MSSSVEPPKVPVEATQPTIFDKIIAKEIPADIVYEDDDCLAFRDINPQAPVHVLLIPKRRIAMLSMATEDDAQLLGTLMLRVARVADLVGLQDGYRVMGKAHKFEVERRTSTRLSSETHEHSLSGFVLLPFLCFSRCCRAVNNGKNGLQSVYHLHLHIVGGRVLKWGPF